MKGPLDKLLTFPHLMVIFLSTVVLGSAIAVVYIQHLNRCLHIELQALYDLRDALHIEWSQLLLEQSTYSADSRVEKLAQEKLHMNLPKPEQTVVMRP